MIFIINKTNKSKANYVIDITFSNIESARDYLEIIRTEEELHAETSSSYISKDVLCVVSPLVQDHYTIHRITPFIEYNLTNYFS